MILSPAQILKCISQLELAQLIGTGVKRKFLAGTGNQSGGHRSSGHHNDLLESGDGMFKDAMSHDAALNKFECALWLTQG